MTFGADSSVIPPIATRGLPATLVSAEASRTPPKPTAREVQELARDTLSRAERAEKQKAMLARIIVCMLRAPLLGRIRLAFAIVFGRPLRIGTDYVERASADQLFANVEGGCYVLGADGGES